MKKVICSVFDLKAAVFATPFYAPNVSVAVRDFANAVNDPAVSISKNPEDFSLYYLGDFEDTTGVFDVRPQPEVLATAASLINFTKGE